MPLQWSLGLIAASTVFLGLLTAKIPGLGRRQRGFLTAASTGILLFIMVEILGEVTEGVGDLFKSARSGFPTLHEALFSSAALLGGLCIGLIGLALFELRCIKGGHDSMDRPALDRQGRISLMIAIGIGIHNLTEGLAIAQSFSWGNERLAWFLALGFGLHNATEGFGMAGPVAGQPVSWGFLGLLGLIGGAPTLVGIWLGGLWDSHLFQLFSFGLASGAILYIVGELLHLGRELKGELVVEVGLLAGFILSYGTEMFLSYVH